MVVTACQKIRQDQGRRQRDQEESRGPLTVAHQRAPRHQFVDLEGLDTLMSSPDQFADHVLRQVGASAGGAAQPGFQLDGTDQGVVEIADPVFHPQRRLLKRGFEEQGSDQQGRQPDPQKRGPYYKERTQKRAGVVGKIGDQVADQHPGQTPCQNLQTALNQKEAFPPSADAVQKLFDSR